MDTAKLGSVNNLIFLVSEENCVGFVNSFAMVKTIYSTVSQDAKVLDLLQRIHKKKGIPVHEMQLFYLNRPLEEHESLQKYGITNGTSLTLKTSSRSADCSCGVCQRMAKNVTIDVTGLQNKSIEVACKLGDPVETIKIAIRKEEGIPISKQKLTFNNVTLEDHKLLASYEFADVEAGGARPVVHLCVGSGDPTVLGKLRSTFSFKGSKRQPMPTAQ